MTETHDGRVNLTAVEHWPRASRLTLSSLLSQVNLWNILDYPPGLWEVRNWVDLVLFEMLSQIRFLLLF